MNVQQQPPFGAKACDLDFIAELQECWNGINKFKKFLEGVLAEMGVGVGPEGPEGPPGPPGSGINFKGTVTDQSALPATGNQTGDMWSTDDGDGFIWDGSQWVGTGNIKGPEGPDGPVGPQGPPGPTGSQGVQGPAGMPLAFVGPDAPADASDGELWYNTNTHQLYVWDAEHGVWSYAGGIPVPGPQGIQGIQGVQGPQGIQGAPGPQGPAGGPNADPNGVGAIRLLSSSSSMYFAIGTVIPSDSIGILDPGMPAGTWISLGYSNPGGGGVNTSILAMRIA